MILLVSFISYRTSVAESGYSGGCICGLFVVAGGLSVLLYRPWRRRIDRRRESLLRNRNVVVQDGTMSPASVDDAGNHAGGRMARKLPDPPMTK